MALTVTPADVAAYAPDAPPVTEAQVREALDWAEPLLERYQLAPEAETRPHREVVRAVCAYALAVAANAAAARTVTDDGRVLKLKDGAEETTFADLDRAALAALPGNWVTRAWKHLHAAGVPRGVRAGGASR